MNTTKWSRVQFGWTEFLIVNSTFSSRPGQVIEKIPADRFAGFSPGPGSAGDGHAVARHVHADALHVLP